MAAMVLRAEGQVIPVLQRTFLLAACILASWQIMFQVVVKLVAGHAHGCELHRVYYLVLLQKALRSSMAA